MTKNSLRLALCSKCTLVQLDTQQIKKYYRNYWYESGINKTMRTHLKKLVKLIIKIKKILKILMF